MFSVYNFCFNFNALFLFCILGLLPCFSMAQEPIGENFVYQPLEQEYNCFSRFDIDAVGVHQVNLFLLAKISELMYLERIDYQLRYVKNGYKVVDTISSSASIKQYARVSDANFKLAFEARFAHFFYKPSPETPLFSSLSADAGLRLPSESEASLSAHYPQFHFIQKTEYWDKKKKQGLDPELIVVSTPRLIIIAFRGTDRVEDDDWSEWKGTDFKIGLVPAGGNLMKTKVHKGFWQSFDLVRDDLIRVLEQSDASKKKIWLTGHSLGGSMAILAGTYLKSIGYPVQNIYAFAAPRVVGNAKFVKKADELLPNRIHRFEYYLDPVALLWAPRYRHVGQRNWFDAEDKGNYQLYVDVKERYIHLWPFHFNRFIKDKRTKSQMRLHKEMHDGLITELPYRFWYHNPQWYVKAAYAALSEEERAVLPLIDDSFPYLYDSAKGPMPGSK